MLFILTVAHVEVTSAASCDRINEEACKRIAQERGVGFYPVISKSDYPPGCLLQNSSNHIYFNNVSSSNSSCSTSYTCICKPGQGNQLINQSMTPPINWIRFVKEEECPGPVLRGTPPPLGLIIVIKIWKKSAKSW